MNFISKQLYKNGQRLWPVTSVHM